MKVSYISDKTPVLFVICSKFCCENERIYKEGESIEILKILSLIKNI